MNQQHRAKAHRDARYTHGLPQEHRFPRFAIREDGGFENLFQELVEIERENCARLAEKYGDPKIAAAIRNRKTPHFFSPR